jgi:hypothetical protein
MTLLLADKIDEVRTTLEDHLQRIREDLNAIEQDPKLTQEQRNMKKRNAKALRDTGGKGQLRNTSTSIATMLLNIVKL